MPTKPRYLISALVVAAVLASLALLTVLAASHASRLPSLRVSDSSPSRAVADRMGTEHPGAVSSESTKNAPPVPTQGTDHPSGESAPVSLQLQWATPMSEDPCESGIDIGWQQGSERGSTRFPRHIRQIDLACPPGRVYDLGRTPARQVRCDDLRTPQIPGLRYTLTVPRPTAENVQVTFAYTWDAPSNSPEYGVRHRSSSGGTDGMLLTVVASSKWNGRGDWAGTAEIHATFCPVRGGTKESCFTPVAVDPQFGQEIVGKTTCIALDATGRLVVNEPTGLRNDQRNGYRPPWFEGERLENGDLLFRLQGFGFAEIELDDVGIVVCPPDDDACGTKPNEVTFRRPIFEHWIAWGETCNYHLPISSLTVSPFAVLGDRVVAMLPYYSARPAGASPIRYLYCYRRGPSAPVESVEHEYAGDIHVDFAGDPWKPTLIATHSILTSPLRECLWSVARVKLLPHVAGRCPEVGPFVLHHFSCTDRVRGSPVEYVDQLSFYPFFCRTGLRGGSCEELVSAVQNCRESEPLP